MADPVRIVLHPHHGAGLADALRDQGLAVATPEHADGVVARLASGAEALVTYRWEDRFAVGAVRWIQALSAGIEQFPLELLAQRGITLTSARGVHSPAVAEHAVALMMAVVRGIGAAVRGAPSRTWRPVGAFEVRGMTMGVVGLGSIGEAIAGQGKALGMEVIGSKRTAAGYTGAADRVFGPGDVREVCRRSDVLVLALPHDPETAGLIGSAELDALGAGWLVNVGRGSVVNEAALLSALDHGELRGAGLDVTAVEPLPEDSPLWDHPSVVITPHIAWSTDRLAGRMADLIATNAAAFRGEAGWVNRVV